MSKAATISFRIPAATALKLEKQIAQSGLNTSEVFRALSELMIDKGVKAVLAAGESITGLTGLPDTIVPGTILNSGTSKEILANLKPGSYMLGKEPLTGVKLVYLLEAGYLWEGSPRRSRVTALAQMTPETFQELYSADQAVNGAIAASMPRLVPCYLTLLDASTVVNIRSYLKRLIALVGSAYAASNWLWFEQEWQKVERALETEVDKLLA